MGSQVDKVKIAVLDLGTNSVHLLVVRIDADLTSHVLDKAKEMVRLGQGTFETGRLDEAAQARALTALKAFTRLAERRGVERVIAVATSAVREAENGGAFLQDVYAQTGVHPKIITGAEEARLVFKAVQRAMPLDETPVLVVDLGGGSAELACGNSRQLSWVASLKLGVQRLEPLALRDGEPSPEGRAALKAHLAAELAPALSRARASRVGRVHVTSGSANAVLKLLRERGEVKPGEDGLPRKALAALDDELSTLPRDKRRTLPGLEPTRADLVVGAVAFFRELAEQLDVPALTVSDRGLREGLVQDFLDKHGPELQWEVTEPNARRRAVLRFAERFGYDAPHHHHVANLAVAIFDATRDLHGLDEAARELLQYGALLHDVGYAVNAKGHHKHGEYLILHGLRDGFTEQEVRVIAALARYHRKRLPKEKDETWSAISAENRDLVERACAILRIADALDRSHSRLVKGVDVLLGDAAVTFRLQTEGSPELEMWAAQRKAEWFEVVFGRAVRFVLPLPDDGAGGPPGGEAPA